MDDNMFKEVLEAIKDSLKELKEDQKEIQKDISAIKITQVEQHITLLDHTKRSTSNEEEIRLAKDLFQKQIAPLQRDNWKFKGGLAFLGIILAVLTVLAAFHRS